MTVRRATAADVPAIAGALARALTDDPSWIHLFPRAGSRTARMETMLGALTRAIYLRHDESWIVGDGAGAALWEPPGAHGLPLLRALRVAPRLAWLIGRRLPAALELFRAMERRHPTEPHWYLAVLGVDPAQQGRGLGPRLLAPVLDRADAERLPCWLESTHPKNHGFYRRLGFVVADEQRFTDALTMTFFARAPR